ncbi:type IX secretion system membrane protein PorP/SprF [Cellulophaga baltica]|uniref:PorP/SprF family type IX secretion system membrane protein n=1 Tax=Cellulophaga TaxID=104264 RepID=UPI001C07500A|nr:MULTISPECIES: type IX secretion system membrane protein PorP/SprF [Cellulophaga]MBU2996461.1 type IX secretion system membrane protein PorP/SprF [Cellulophaga baltica]MDO6767855.1 type IX secretion system membrane protein PorP/SprF [Cellulophaga sp. 1_MG-2023]
MNFRNHIKSLIVLLLLAVPFFNANAQQDAQYTQYMYNTLAINPGYTGSRGVLSIAALHRSQWVGLDGAPTTQTFNIHSPINNRVGLGLSIVNDEIGNGTNQDTYFDATFSYTILASETDKISFGLKAGGHFLNIDFNQLRVYDPSSAPPGTTNIDKKFSPNFGAGIYFHNERFYAGVSIPNFLETEHFDTSETSYVGTERMNWYFISGYVFDLSYNLKLKPAILFKGVNGAPLQADASATLLYNDTFSLGAGYRWDAALSALLGFQITERLMIGLAYDKETTTLGASSFNDGSFEVFLRYEFKSKNQNALTPRFF